MYFNIYCFARQDGAQSLKTDARNRLAPNGHLPTTLREPNKQTRHSGFRGFAGKRNVGEARAAARRTPSPTRISKGDAWAG